MEIFNLGWEFKLEGGRDWLRVRIPHDWLIGDTRNLYKSGVGLYRKFFNLDAAPAAGGNIFLRFDGVYQDSTLFVNGEVVGSWKNGYTAFTYDISSFLRAGENEIIMKVNYESPNSRWYSGAGIYRDCWLIRKKAAYIVPDGVYISTKKTCDGWIVNVDTEIETGGLDCKISHSITYLNPDESVNLPVPVYEVLQEDKLLVKNPELWTLDSPVCYKLVSRIIYNENQIDEVETRFGFREIEFSPKGGFFLNGEQIKINGVCQHHDLGALGAAFHKDAQKRQLMILKEMGVNAIRSAHNPPAADFMELTDTMGFLVMTEFTDMWKRPKTTYDYARFFEEWAERDVAAWVRRDRNCPSIIMWCIGNEIYDTHADAEDGAATTKWLMDLVRRHDPNGHAPITLCSNYMPWENTQKCADLIKLVGYNYADYLYKSHKEAYPDWIIYGGETAATVQSRGIYHFPLSKALLADDDLQCSSLGNSSTSWGAKSTEAVIIDHRDVLGQFIWTGTDYIGEPTPYHTKNSYLGQIDTAGFSKDSFYIFKSAWTEFSKQPMVHLFPYWDWSPGQPIDVRIASNAPKVELFLNEKSLGVTEIDHKRGTSIVANYVVPYEPGCLKAIAYCEKGNIIAEAVRNSFGDAVEPRINCTRIGELVFAEIYAVDKSGNPVENANNRIKIEVSGGELLGLDNGDSTDYDQYQGTYSRRLFSGKLLAIVKSEDSKMPVITANFDDTDVPVRKIELIYVRAGSSPPHTTGDCCKRATLNLARKKLPVRSIIRDGFTVQAKIHPENATYRDLSWRLADAGGIDSPLGRLVVDCQTAVLHPKGDGEVYVRCSVSNGKPHPDLISLLPITITGYGKPFLNPYSFISGGLYTHSNIPMTNGNERGIATSRDAESQVGFADIDFGSFGSSEITLWLFPLVKHNFTFEIWQGKPNKPGSRLLLTPTYDKGSIWNTYQAVTYKLPERLTRIQTLYLVFNLKVHIKGFVFKSKTYEIIPFAACDNIYGDSFEVKGQAVENIGNNVTITFKEMDFTRATKTLELRWRSHQDKNSINLLFADEEGMELLNTISLPESENYAATTVTLDKPLRGKGDVSFIFLPGSAIDLESFRFVQETEENYG